MHAEAVAPAEVAASRIISAHLHTPVVQHDDGTKPGMHDLDIRYPDGRGGAVEVTAAEDEPLAADYGALRGRALLRKRRSPEAGSPSYGRARMSIGSARPCRTYCTASSRPAGSVLWFAARGVTVQRVLTDNGACYRSPPSSPTKHGALQDDATMVLVEWRGDETRRVSTLA